MPEGLDVDEDEPAGRDETKTEDKPAGPDGTHYYLLVNPRPGEAPDHDNSIIVQCTGTDRSTMHYHGTMDNPPYSQHQEGGDGNDSGSDTHHGRLARDDAHHNLHARDLTREGAKKKDEDAGRYKEVRSIRGAGRRTTRWVRENPGGRRRSRTATRGATPPSTRPRGRGRPWARR